MLEGVIGFFFGLTVAAMVILGITNWYLALLLTIGATVIYLAFKWGRDVTSIGKERSSDKTENSEKKDD